MQPAKLEVDWRHGGDVDDTLLLEVLEEIPTELRDQRTPSPLTAEHVRKLDRLVEARFIAVERRFEGIERRFGDVERKITDVRECIGRLKDDLELMVKRELVGHSATSRPE